MTSHSSATALGETPHATETTTITISDALRRRAMIDAQIALFEGELLAETVVS